MACLTAYLLARTMRYNWIQTGSIGPGRPIVSRSGESHVSVAPQPEDQRNWYISRVKALPRKGRLRRVAYSGECDSFNFPLKAPVGGSSRSLSFDGSESPIELSVAGCSGLEIKITSFSFKRLSRRFTVQI